MIDRAKSIALTLLVGLSMFLTWQLWTYQPQYEVLLEPVQVLQEGLADRMEITELIHPERIIHHATENDLTVSYPHTFYYNVVYGKREEWVFVNVRSIPRFELSEWSAKLLRSTGVEIQFPTAITEGVLQELFQIDPLLTDLLPIDRIWLYDDEDANQVQAVLLASEHRSMYHADVNIDVAELHTYVHAPWEWNQYEALQKSRTDGTAPLDFEDTLDITNSAESALDIFDLIYYPLRQVSMTEYRLLYQRIPEEALISHLFVDPSLVTQTQVRNDSSFYTDGTRGLQNDHQHMIAHFFHPQNEWPRNDNQVQSNMIQRGVQYVNQHKGWDMTYALDKVEGGLFDQEKKISFRQQLQDRDVQYPLYSVQEDYDQHMIHLDMQGGQVIAYKRPLLELDQMIDSRLRQLPSGLDVLQVLRERNVDLNQIQRLRTGYQSELTATYVRLIPYWIIEMENGQRHFVNTGPAMREGDS